MGQRVRLDSGDICIYVYAMKRFVMNIPDQLHRRLKIVSTLQGRTMTQVALQLLEDYVEKEEKRKLILYPSTHHASRADGPEYFRNKRR
jgi:plasmid stability protein